MDALFHISQIEKDKNSHLLRGIFYKGGESIHHGVASVKPSASNMPQAYCLKLFDSPLTKKKDHPLGWSFFLKIVDNNDTVSDGFKRFQFSETQLR
jgi:hypothetical protein